MFLIYHPEGSEEPTRWKYDFRRLTTMEREAIEKRTGTPFAEWTQLVLKGSTVARRALLFTMLRRTNSGVRWEDVTFMWDELRLEYSRGELLLQREKAIESHSGAELDAILAHIDSELEDAFDDAEESGKARLPVAG